MTFKGTKGPGKYTGKGLKVSSDGVLIAARGHMHVSCPQLEISVNTTDLRMLQDGGESMTASLNGKPICVSKAEYGASYSSSTTTSKWTTISKMTDCNEVIPVKKGDLITLEAAYDTIKHPL
jgi:hypothetical protein